MTTLAQTVSRTPLLPPSSLLTHTSIVLDFLLHSACMAGLPMCPVCLHKESTVEGNVLREKENVTGQPKNLGCVSLLELIKQTQGWTIYECLFQYCRQCRRAVGHPQKSAPGGGQSPGTATKSRILSLVYSQKVFIFWVMDPLRQLIFLQPCFILQVPRVGKKTSY